MVISYGPPPSYRAGDSLGSFDVDRYIELLKGDDVPGEFTFFWWNDADAAKIVFEFTDENAAFMLRLHV